jgi:malate synthase
MAGIEIRGAMAPRFDEILTGEALDFVADLQRAFNNRRKELLAARAARQARFDAGELPDFLAETASIRAGDWKIAPIPKDLLDRRVEITGPVDRKMVVNALNSGAKVFMTDFEDANSPTWSISKARSTSRISGPARSISPMRQQERPTSLAPTLRRSSSARAAGIFSKAISLSMASPVQARCSISGSIFSTT